MSSTHRVENSPDIENKVVTKQMAKSRYPIVQNT